MSWNDCRRITRENAKSFYFASFPLPTEKRDATYATYAFCRVADDIVDESAPAEAETARLRLDELRSMIDSIELGETPSHPLWGPFAETVRRYGIPVSCLRALLDGVESDLTPRRFEQFDDLHGYCYSVASTVGIALSHIFGFRDDEALDYAANMGIAMQLTNIIRDVSADYAMGRVYLPLDELRRYGVTEDMLEQNRLTPEIANLLRFQVARAREYYRRAFQGIRYLTRDGSHWTAYLMGDVYRSILNDVERHSYDVFSRRASVSLTRKIMRSAMAPIGFRREVLAETRPVFHLPDTVRD